MLLAGVGNVDQSVKLPRFQLILKIGIMKNDGPNREIAENVQSDSLEKIKFFGMKRHEIHVSVGTTSSPLPAVN